MHVIETLAEFASTQPRGTLPERTQKRTALLVADLVAASIAGSASQLGQAAAAAALSAYGDQGPAPLWFKGASSSLAGAAMANAAAASALDIDDGHRGAAGHPGAGIIPAVFAVAEALSAPDDDIFDAIALGYDIALRIAASRPTGSFPTYSSGRWVGYGAAAAVARLLHLEDRAFAHALAIAGAEGPVSFPTGTSRYHGSTVKEAIPPAVTAGLTAAFRARAGATGPLDLLDSPDLYRPEIVTSDLGQSWWIEGCYLKPYACCRYMHAAVDAILALRRPGAPIRSLRIETFPQGLRLSNARRPATLEAGQYSYYFSCALAALRGQAALQPVAPSSLADTEVLELAARIDLAAHPDFEASFPAATPCRVILDQGAGPEVLTVTEARGDVGNPMSEGEVLEKLRRLASGILPPPRVESLVSALTGLTRFGFAPLFAALRPGAHPDDPTCQTKQGGLP